MHTGNEPILFDIIATSSEVEGRVGRRGRREVLISIYQSILQVLHPLASCLRHPIYSCFCLIMCLVCNVIYLLQYFVSEVDRLAYIAYQK